MPFMKRFRANTSASGWTRRHAIIGAAGLAACSNPPVAAQAPGTEGLWPQQGAPALRGAVIAQRRRRAAVDGDTIGGGGPVLPAYRRSDFDALAEAGANLVVMSFPELWTVGPPWRRDPAMADVLGQQLDDARAAGLFVVLALRSGPGRSDFIYHRDSAGDWFSEDLIVDSIWRERDAQAAWGAMCADAARLIVGRSEIAGLNIMVEPEPNVGGLNRDGGRLGAWEPDQYLAAVSDVSDWKRIAGDVAREVRAAAPGLPILISPPAFGRTDFLSVMGAPPVDGVVWCVHDYEPRGFTHHPEASAGIAVFSEGGDNTFEKRIDAVRANAGAAIFLGEFGASRWAQGVDEYYAARIAACEERGINWAAFRWPTRDKGYEESDSMFSLLKSGGRDAAPAIATLRPAWSRNTLRPGAAQLRGRN